MSKRAEKLKKKRIKEKQQAQRPEPKPEWTKFVEHEPGQFPRADLLGGQENVDLATEGIRMFFNNKYKVLIRWVDSGWGPLLQMSIAAINREPCHDWREFQRIKNDIFGEEAEAIELYPAESRLVDTSNQYYLHCLPPRKEDGEIIWDKFPFGYQSRLVTEKPWHGGRQRPWSKETRPNDLMDLTSEMMKGYFDTYAERKREEKTQTDDHSREPTCNQEEPQDRVEGPSPDDEAKVGG